VVVKEDDTEYVTVADPASHLSLHVMRELLRVGQDLKLPDITTTSGWGDSTGPAQLCCSPFHLSKCSGTVVLFAPRLHQNRGCSIRASDEPSELAAFAARALRESKEKNLGLVSVIVVSGQHAPGQSHFERWYDPTLPRDKCLELAHIELNFHGAHYGAVVLHRDGANSGSKLKVFTTAQPAFPAAAPVTFDNCFSCRWNVVCDVALIPRGGGSRSDRLCPLCSIVRQFSRA
jgi:hypothetical protein